MKYESQQAKDLGSNTVAEIRLLPESENILTWFVYSDGKIFIIPDLKNKEKVIALASRGSIYVNVLGTVKKANISAESNQKLIANVRKRYEEKYGWRNCLNLLGPRIELLIVLTL